MPTIDRIGRNEDGTLPSYAWPGGYQIYYYGKDNSIVCPDCANKYETKAKNLEEDDFLYKWEQLEGFDIYYEGPIIPCEECNCNIESAYGDPDDDRV